MCKLFEMLARQFGAPTLQVLQSEYRGVAQLGEQELFGFLCMLERGCGYVAKGLSYDAAFREVIKPLLENPATPAACAMECVAVCDVCFHLFSDASRAESVRLCIAALAHDSVGVQLTAVEALSHVLRSSNCTPALAAHAAPLIVERLEGMYRVSDGVGREAQATQSKQSKTYMVALLAALVETVADSAHFSGLVFASFQLMWGEAVALGDEMTQLLLLRLACSIVKVSTAVWREAQKLPSLLTPDGRPHDQQGVSQGVSQGEGEARMGPALEFFFRVVQYAVHDAAGEVVSLLLEDGLELWSDLMKCPAARYGERLHGLFQSLLLVYSHSMKSFPAIISIVDSYVRLGQLAFLQAYGPALAQLYDTLFSIVAPRDMMRLATSIHFITLLYPQQGAAIATPCTHRFMALLLQRERTSSNGE